LLAPLSPYTTRFRSIGSSAFFGYLMDSGPWSSHPASRRSLTLRTNASLLGASSMVYLLTGRRAGLMLILRRGRDLLPRPVRTSAVLHLPDTRWTGRLEGSSPLRSGYCPR